MPVMVMCCSPSVSTTVCLNKTIWPDSLFQCTPPTGQPFYLQNRINFTQPVTSSTAPQQHPWTSSQDAPFQKFHWVHFPPDVVPGDFKYTVTARYCQGSGLVDGPSGEVTVQLMKPQT